jgi:hypothetical protein
LDLTARKDILWARVQAVNPPFIRQPGFAMSLIGAVNAVDNYRLLLR